MIKSLDLTKNANNLYISIKERKPQPSSLSAAGQAILFKDWKFFEKNSYFKATGPYGAHPQSSPSNKTEQGAIENSLKLLKIKREEKIRNPLNLHQKPSKIPNDNEEEPNNTEEIPQYFDIYDKPNQHYRRLFKPNLPSSEIDNEPSKIYFSTPQDQRQTKKRKILNDLNFSISKIKKEQEATQLYLDQSEKKVHFADNHTSRMIRSPDRKDTKETEDGFLACPEGCGRSFASTALARHIKICKNVFLSKKDPFDMTSQRKLKESQELENRRKLKEGELLLLTERAEILKKEQEMKDLIKNQPENFPKWKRQSEALRAVMQSNRGDFRRYDAEFIREGLNKSKYVKCDGCGRMFNEGAAERHVKGCLDRIQNLKLHKKRMII